MECPVSNSFEVWLVCDCHLAVPQYSLALLCLCKLALCVLVETDAEHSTIKMEMKNCLWVRSVRIHTMLKQWSQDRPIQGSHPLTL